MRKVIIHNSIRFGNNEIHNWDIDAMLKDKDWNRVGREDGAEERKLRNGSKRSPVSMLQKLYLR